MARGSIAARAFSLVACSRRRMSSAPLAHALWRRPGRRSGVEVGLAGEAKALGGLAVGGDETDGEAGIVGVVGVKGGDDGFLHEFLTLLGGRVEERGEAGTEAVKRDPGDGGMKGGERFATMFMVAAVRFLSYWGAEMVVSMIDFNSS
jgi:hypothetical protein